MLTHARLCKVLACVALTKRKTFSALFLSQFLDLGFFLWMVGKTSSNLFLQELILLHSVCVLYIHLAGPAVQTWRAPHPEVFGRAGRVRRGVEDEQPHLLPRLCTKDPVQNPAVPVRLLTFIDSYLSPFLWWKYPTLDSAKGCKESWNEAGLIYSIYLFCYSAVKYPAAHLTKCRSPIN